MAKLTPSHVLFASSLLALAGCAKDEAPKGQSHGEWQGAEATTGSDSASAEAKPMEQAELPQRPSESASAKAEGTPKHEEPAPALSDGQILEVMSVVDAGEVEQGQLAQKKATDTRVEDFARQMIRQHTQAKQKGEKLSATAQIALADSAVAGELRNGSTQVIQELSAKEAGDEFDRLYMKAQADQHARVLQLLDQRLIPGASNASLKNQLVNTRTMVKLHLTQARDLHEDLVEREKQ